jgi:hypothetical protein
MRLLMMILAFAALGGCVDIEGTKARAIEEAKTQCEGHGKVFVLGHVEVQRPNDDVAVRGYCVAPGEQVPPDIQR